MTDNGRTVVTLDYRSILLWDAATGQELGQLVAGIRAIRVPLYLLEVKGSLHTGIFAGTEDAKTRLRSPRLCSTPQSQQDVPQRVVGVGQAQGRLGLRLELEGQGAAVDGGPPAPLGEALLAVGAQRVRGGGRVPE